MSAGDRERPGEEARERVLFFRSGEEAFALPVSAVSEVVVGADLTPVPMGPPEVLGVVNRRGKIFTVVDFSRLAGLGGGPGGNGGRAVFLHRPDMTVGVAVAGIDGIAWVPRRLLEAARPPGEGGSRSFLGGLLDFGGRAAALVDADRLAGAIAGLSERPGE